MHHWFFLFQMQSQEEIKSPEAVAITKRDQELKELVDQYNSKKRAKPLVDIHKKKMKVSLVFPNSPYNGTS